MVGGAYISGTASEIATKGLVNTIAPIGYNIGLAIGNKVFICISYSTPCLVNARLLHELLFFFNVIFLSNTVYTNFTNKDKLSHAQ